MRILGLALLGLAVAFASVSAAGDKKDGKDKGEGVGALPPHPLDGAFERGFSPRDLTNGLLNNKHFQKAVEEAAKAKAEQEARLRKNPKLLDATPAQAARRAFLEVIQGGGKVDKDKKSDK